VKKRIKKFSRERKNFTGIFEGDYIEDDFFGNQIRKIIFSNITDGNGNLIKDKQEFIYSNDFIKNNLNIGDIVQFDARIVKDARGYLGSRKDIDQNELEIKLIRPTKIIKK
jgi:hypothetical protein